MASAAAERFGTTDDLEMAPRDTFRAARACAASLVGVTAFIVLLDTVFRHHLTPQYVSSFTGPLLPHIGAMIRLAALEEVWFRLFLMSGIIYLGTIRAGRAPRWFFWCAIALAQFANVGLFVIADPVYASLRYWAVGCVWGWLYWRHGWLTALAGHCCCHLLLDPALYLLLSS